MVEPVADGSLISSEDPQDEVLRREDISLAFVTVLQRLPPRQRACLLLHDVLGFTHDEVAEALGTSVASVNSLLFRARQAALPRGPQSCPEISDPRVQELLERYLAVWHLADIDAFVSVVTEDVRFSMPPFSEWFEGVAAVADFVEGSIFSGRAVLTGLRYALVGATASLRSPSTSPVQQARWSPQGCKS